VQDLRQIDAGDEPDEQEVEQADDEAPPGPSCGGARNAETNAWRMSSP